jgi:hypothetical protein
MTADVLRDSFFLVRSAVIDHRYRRGLRRPEVDRYL